MSTILVGVIVLAAMALIIWLAVKWTLKEDEVKKRDLEDRQNPRAGSQPSRRPRPPR